MKTNVRSTSIKTYYDIIDEGLLGEQEEVVLDYFFANPWTTDHECSAFTGLPINSVTGRRNGLVKQGCLVEGAKRKDTFTNRVCLTWGVPERIRFNEEVFIKSLSKKCPFCNGKGFLLVPKRKV